MAAGLRALHCLRLQNVVELGKSQTTRTSGKPCMNKSLPKTLILAPHSAIMGAERKQGTDSTDVSTIIRKPKPYLDRHGLVVFEPTEAVFGFQGVSIRILRRVEGGCWQVLPATKKKRKRADKFGVHDCLSLTVILLIANCCDY